MSHCTGIERLRPVAIGQAPAHETDLGIKNVPVVTGTIHQFLICIYSSRRARQVCNRPVVVCVFERFRYRLFLLVTGNEPQLPILTQSTIIVLESPLPPERISALVVHTANSFCVGFGENWSRVVADHATRLATL